MRRKWILWLGAFVLVLTLFTVLSGCTTTETNTEPKMATLSETSIQKAEITNLSAQEAYSLIQEKMDDPDFKIIDVRTPDEYNSGHVEGAINIDYNSDTFKDIMAELDRTGEYLVYCRSGARSSGAVKVMEELGFTMIYHMGGGIIEWSSEGLPFAR
ncbi:MAG: rhodanese-like domain-containing protein [Dehalococcoidales bacterium]|nr:MAG: rhodanese-like domain-containing protein [Dehalococcoidales bacterium]